MPKKLRLSGCGWALGCAVLLAGCHDPGPGTAGSGSGSGGPVGTTATGGSALLSWEAPTTNTNGTPLTDLAGYRIYYGPSESKLTSLVPIDSVGIQTYVIDDLEAGTWYFAVRAVTSQGTESDLSRIVSKTIG